LPRNIFFGSFTFLQITISVIAIRMTNSSSPSSSSASAKGSPSVACGSADKPRRRKASANQIEILPPLPDADDWTCTPDDITLPPELEFDTIERRPGRNAVTPMKQRVFIRVLAETGRVELAARAAGNGSGSFYYLRNTERGQSFAAAWLRALDFGTGRVLDILLDHAINGVPEYIYKDGVLVAERRRFNHNLMMWLVAHNMPEKFGVHGGLMHSGSGGAAGAARMNRLKAEWHSEWEAEYKAKNPAKATRAETDAAILKRLKVLRINFQYEEASKFVGDAEAQAAWELLYGPQDWAVVATYRQDRDEIRRRDAAGELAWEQDDQTGTDD
jgi:hypothetical protein